MLKNIIVKGAKEHNLKNLSVEIPREKLVIITGLSGSGKSSLAFDTLYAEGQRRYVESLSAYARQFLSLMEKPDVEYIEGLSPAISIEQKSTSHNPRSTVGTITEIYDYLRLLFARVGEPHCPTHHIKLEAQSISQMVDQVLGLPEGTRVNLLAPVIRERKAYPVYDTAYKAALDEVVAWLSGLENFQTVGRNGQHRYNNQDHSMLSAMLAARNVLGADNDIWNINVERSYHEEMQVKPAAEIA